MEPKILCYLYKCNLFVGFFEDILFIRQRNPAFFVQKKIEIYNMYKEGYKVFTASRASMKLISVTEMLTFKTIFSSIVNTITKSFI